MFPIFVNFREIYSLNLLSFSPGVDPAIVQKAWVQGFFRIIMCSETLSETKDFPREVFATVKKYRDYFLSQRVLLYCNSTFAGFTKE